jgi:hypothetical protein
LSTKYRRRRLIKRVRRGFIISLFSILITLGAIELILRIWDPWGAVRYMQDMDQMASNFIEDPYRDYTMKPGVYHFSNWSATILDSKTRNVPNTNPNSKCQIAMVGDSATFAHGVSDADTWVNLIARQLPDVHILNAGGDGFNIDSVFGTLNGFPDVNGFLYLMINNDAEPAFRWNRSFAAITIYLFYAKLFGIIPSPPSTNASESETVGSSSYSHFYDVFEKLLLDKRVIVVAFDMGGLTDEASKRYTQDVHIIPFYTTINSPADSHADVNGNKEIATNILPYVKALVNRVCAF